MWVCHAPPRSGAPGHRHATNSPAPHVSTCTMTVVQPPRSQSVCLIAPCSRPSGMLAAWGTLTHMGPRQESTKHATLQATCNSLCVCVSTVVCVGGGVEGGCMCPRHYCTVQAGVHLQGCVAAPTSPGSKIGSAFGTPVRSAHLLQGHGTLVAQLWAVPHQGSQRPSLTFCRPPETPVAPPGAGAHLWLRSCVRCCPCFEESAGVPAPLPGLGAAVQ